MKTSLYASLLLAGMLSPPAFAQTASSDGYVLDKVVQVSRHGVRPPTESNEKLLTRVTQRQWPTWLVPLGNLTGHGYTGAVEMGRYRGQVLRTAGLIPKGCPDARQLLVHASPMQRTKATAQALLDGMFPGCGFQPTYVAGKQDALFQANEMPFAALDPAKAKAQILKALGGSVEAAQERYKPFEEKLRGVACLPAADCPYGKQPWVLEENAKGRLTDTGYTIRLDVEAAARLATVRPRMAELSEELNIPAENLLTPDFLRRISWRPPSPITLETVSAQLAELGARPWQVEKTAPLLAEALAHPDPLEPRKPREEQEAS